jgi:hypothetical protein
MVITDVSGQPILTLLFKGSGQFVPKSRPGITTIKLKVTLEQATNAQRWRRGIAPLFLKVGARWGGWSTPRPGQLTPGKTRYPLYSWLGGPQGRSGRVRKISPLTGFRSPDRPACSESLYRLSYPGPQELPLYAAQHHRRAQFSTTLWSVYAKHDVNCI